MSCTANSKYGIKELSTIFDSGMLLPYFWQRDVLAIVDPLDHGQNISMANCLRMRTLAWAKSKKVLQITLQIQTYIRTDYVL